MVAAKAAIATSGHNITNASTEGFSRQRVVQEANQPKNAIGSSGYVGDGVRVARVERLNDEYVEKQIRNGQKDLSHFEEKDMVLRQTEDIFNEMNGEGLNRVMSHFFNEFRKLANDPDNEAIRQSVREASQSMVNDFHRLNKEVDEVRRHIDSRVEGAVGEINSLAVQIKDLNLQIQRASLNGMSPNDLMDRRDQALKQLGTFMDLSMHKDGDNAYYVEIKGVGPLIAGPSVEHFSVARTGADEDGKLENTLELRTSASAQSNVTHSVKGGKIGALLEVRDGTLTTISDRLDELAHTLVQSVNEIHSQGFDRFGNQGVAFFKPIEDRARASEFIDLSDAVRSNASHIATAAAADAPGDNRIALAITGLQQGRLMGDGKTTVDDFYNSIVSDVGVTAARNRSNLNQQHDIQTQLGKIRDQHSGVSIDEETANLMQFEHAFQASARVIQVADDMLKTVLELKR